MGKVGLGLFVPRQIILDHSPLDHSPLNHLHLEVTKTICLLLFALVCGCVHFYVCACMFVYMGVCAHMCMHVHVCVFAFYCSY